MRLQAPKPNAQICCNRCAPTKHTRQECPHKKSICTTCAKTGRLAIVCAGRSIDQVLCSCCGVKNTAKQNVHRTTCNDQCAIKWSICKQLVGARSRPKKKQAKEKRQRRNRARQSEPSSECSNPVAGLTHSCMAMLELGLPRFAVPGKRHQVSNVQNGTRQGSECHKGRGGAATHEVLLSRPQAEVQVASKHMELTELIDTLGKQGMTEWAEATRKEKEKMPKPVAGRSAQDKVEATAHVAELNSAQTTCQQACSKTTCSKARAQRQQKQRQHSSFIA